jgi:hypothetical protein
MCQSFPSVYARCEDLKASYSRHLHGLQQSGQRGLGCVGRDVYQEQLVRTILLVEIMFVGEDLRELGEEYCLVLLSWDAMNSAEYCV